MRFIRLLGQVRERIRYLHYSRSTEKVFLYWVRFFVRRQGRHGTITHPREMGAPQGEAFLTMLALPSERYQAQLTTRPRARCWRTTMMYAHVLKVAAGCIASPLDALTA